MANYFLIINGQQVGPYPKENLLFHGIQPGTPVWREGMSDWQPASSLPELSDLFQSAFGAYAEAQPEPEPKPQYSANPCNQTCQDSAGNPQPQQQQWGQPQQPQQQWGQTQFGQQQPWGQPRFGQQPYPQPIPHFNWMNWAIASTIFGFLFSCIGMIFGIIAINAASKANAAYAAGNRYEGDSNNSTAKTMTIIALVVAGIGILGTIFYAIAIAAAFI